MSNIESNLKKLLRGKKACMPGKYLKVPYHGSSEKLRPGKGTPLGQGMYGKVYRGSINDNGRRYVAYKEIDTSLNSEGTSDFEFKVAQKLKKYAVPKMYLYKKCEDEKMNILYMERLEGVDFNRWWQTEPSLEAIKSVITQVMYNLYQIGQDIPGFRHQDLHGGNVIVSKDLKVPFSWKVGNKTYTSPNGGVNAVMIDFGLSHFPRMTNPTLKNGGYKHVGIPDKGPAHPLYDLHLFLYTIFAKVRHPQDRKERLIHNFIKKIIPNTDFLTFNGPYTTMGRISMRNEGGGLKDSVKRSGERKWLLEVSKSVPTFEDVLTHPFLTGETQVAPILKMIPKARTPPKSKTPKAKTKTPSPKLSTAERKKKMNSAIKRAAAVLAAKPKTKPAPRRRPGIARTKPVSEIKTATPIRLSFVDVNGKNRVFRSKAWYDKALAKKVGNYVNGLSNNEVNALKKKICQP